ncbi:hypothetical protein [Fusobacterium ulcerans]|uniref:hypothetical protein n=1 Tax=Fusobacterium ulcerans TaxID=861 RepID=UPI0026DB891A|nr:hypothetical protein [Fusobacterium ulcerans]
MEEMITTILSTLVSKYGILGLLVGYLIYLDRENRKLDQQDREIDREDRRINRNVLEEMQKNLAASSERIAKVEVRTQNLEKEVFKNKGSGK